MAIEKTFMDRVPTYPGRVKLTHVGGDFYDMERADEPLVAGTPIDKAAFDSIVQSRLTGRFYIPGVVSTPSGAQSGLTTNPIPTSGWININLGRSTNGQYIATVNEAYGNYPSFPFDGNDNTSWVGNSSLGQWIMLELPSAITVRKMSVKLGIDTSTTPAVSVEGSNDGLAWATLHTTNASIGAFAVTYALTNPGLYKYYRLRFSFAYANAIEVYKWEFTEYDLPTFTNQFTVDNFPAVWSEGQRATVQIPAGVNSAGVTGNTLNGVPVNTILQPSKRYELRYTGSAFVAKEV